MSHEAVEKSTSQPEYSLAQLIGARVSFEGAYENPPLKGTILEITIDRVAENREEAIFRNTFLVRLDDGRSFPFAGSEFTRVEG